MMIPQGNINITFDELPPAFQAVDYERAMEENGHAVWVGKLGDSVAVQLIGEPNNFHAIWITLANDERAIIAEYNTLVMVGLFMQVFREKAYLAIQQVSGLLNIRTSATVHIEGDDKRAIKVSIDEEIGIITIGIVPKEEA